MSKVPLTKRQLQILDFFKAYTREHGLSPTLEEVAQNFGVNKVTIFGHVSELERKGVLIKAAAKKSRARQLAFDDAPPQARTTTPTALGAPGENRADAADGAQADRRGVVTILGRIAAGSPIETIEDPEQLELADLLPRDRECYALRVRGQSMIDDGIHDGDLVLVERKQTARDGEMVVAVLPDEEATLKRFFREPDGVRLEPANATMQPIRAPSVEIRGVVIGVVRRF
ncbi:MAG: transcriptional repressor LexA [Planctomycetes bacterium]|nr:transcriptional repressor LexA [Planctomycetota bacterium]